MLTPSTISVRTRGVARPSDSCRRLLFSTTHALRAGGPLFNLGGLGASREAQYLSKERGIPRTEYSANIHLIRSSEVDPFAPAPGATRTAVARAAARAQAEAEAELASGALSAEFPRGPMALGGTAGLLDQLHAMRNELVETKAALYRMQAQRMNPEKSTSARLLDMALFLTILFIIGKGIDKWYAQSPRPTDDLIRAQAAQPIADEIDEATAQRRREAPAEEQVLAETGLTSFQRQPAMVQSPRSSVLSGLFWART